MVFIKLKKKPHTKNLKIKRWQLSYIVILMVANIIYSDRLNATWVKCHLVAINPGGNYQGNQICPACRNFRLQSQVFLFPLLFPVFDAFT